MHTFKIQNNTYGQSTHFLAAVVVVVVAVVAAGGAVIAQATAVATSLLGASGGRPPSFGLPAISGHHAFSATVDEEGVVAAVAVANDVAAATDVEYTVGFVVQ